MDKTTPNSTVYLYYNSRFYQTYMKLHTGRVIIIYNSVDHMRHIRQPLRYADTNLDKYINDFMSGHNNVGDIFIAAAVARHHAIKSLGI